MCAFKWDRVAGIVNEDIDETTEEFEFGCRVFSRRIVFAYCKTTWDKNDIYVVVFILYMIH